MSASRVYSVVFLGVVCVGKGGTGGRDGGIRSGGAEEMFIEIDTQLARESGWARVRRAAERTICTATERLVFDMFRVMVGELSKTKS